MAVASTKTARTVLTAYRELYWLVTRRHGKDARMRALLDDAAMRIRGNATKDPSSVEVQDGIRTLASTVAFVRASTSGRGRRTFGEAGTVVSRADAGRRYVLRDGELIDADSDEGRKRVATGVLSHEEAWAYHNRLIDRQHFGRRLKKFKPEPL